MTARALVAAPIVVLESALFAVLALLAGLPDRSGRWSHAVAAAWGRSVLASCGVRVVVAGTEHCPKGPAVYAANHFSIIDIPLLFGYLPPSFRIIHKRSIYWIPLIGWWLWAAGHVGISRRSPFKARKNLEEAARRIRGGLSVAVFPEGTRSPDGAVRLFKRGSFLLALDAGVPVVPVSLEGVERVAPGTFFSLRSGTVRVRVHPALATAGRPREAAEALAEETRAVVARACAEGA